MTDEEHRKKSRLSLERWRRSRGVKPKKRPLPRPWLAEGVPQSTWYRRRKQEQDAAARNEISKPAELIQVTGHHLLTLNARRAITILWHNAQRQGIQKGRDYTIETDEFNKQASSDPLEETVQALMCTALTVKLANGETHHVQFLRGDNPVTPPPFRHPDLQPR